MDELRFKRAQELARHPPRSPRVAVVNIMRMASSRLQGKTILPLGGYPAWWHCLQRGVEALKLCGIEPVGVGVACPGTPENDIIEMQARKYGYDCLRHPDETDVAGRELLAFDHYDVDIMLMLSGDCPLVWYEHAPLLWPSILKYNRAPNLRWPKPWPEGDPARNVTYVVGTIGFSLRWNIEAWVACAETAEERECGMVCFRNHPGQESKITDADGPSPWYSMPQEMFDLYRWYMLEVDVPEDAIVMMMLYQRFWNGPGTLVDVRQCLEYIDAHPWYQYNRERVESAVNQESKRIEQAKLRSGWLTYCEKCLKPKGAKSLKCAKCGEYLGYVQHRDGHDEFHRPDGSVLVGSAKVECGCGYNKVWQWRWNVNITGGSAIYG